MYILLTSGRGPVECQQAVKYAVSSLMLEAKKFGFTVDMVDNVETEHGFLSALVDISGNDLTDFVKSWTGTIQWICKSSIRPNQGRKNWFIGSNVIPERPEFKTVNPKDLRVETMTAGGAGGQHQNKTESAVRITHLPTGISAISRDERSQHRNKAIAIARLHKALYELDNANLKEAERSQWDSHNDLVRGNPVRVYEGLKFKRMV